MSPPVRLCLAISVTLPNHFAMRPFLKLIPFAFVCAISFPAVAQYQAAVLKSSGSGPIAPQTIEIPAGKVLNVAFFSAYNTTAVFFLDGVRLNATPAGMMVPGPANLEITIPDATPPANCGVVVTYRITDNDGTGGVQGLSNGAAVVVPEDASGPVQIILESSTDLVSWTEANPGTYGASTTRRFFRVRAVQN